MNQLTIYIEKAPEGEYGYRISSRPAFTMTTEEYKYLQYYFNTKNLSQYVIDGEVILQLLNDGFIIREV